MLAINNINGCLRRGLHLEIFDLSRLLIEPRIWIYAGYYHNYIDDDYDDDNDVDLLYDDVDVNDDYACGITFGS